MNEILRSVRDQLERSGRLRSDEARDLLRPICSTLLQLGIRRVVMQYSGGGDEGAIQSSSFLPEKVDVPEELRHLAEDWACAVLPPGWENNEGGQGNVTIDVANETALNEHMQNVLTIESAAWACPKTWQRYKAEGLCTHCGREQRGRTLKCDPCRKIEVVGKELAALKRRRKNRNRSIPARTVTPTARSPRRP
jgi:hypothetical protein